MIDCEGKTEYEKMKELLQRFTDEHEPGFNVECDLQYASRNDANKRHISYLCGDACKNISVIDMDAIAHRPYRFFRFPESAKEEDSAASVDAFWIDTEQEWYLIEFKDQKILTAKDSVIKKAYANWYWLMDILYSMKDKNVEITFDYANPIAFTKERVTYILVVSEEKNYPQVQKIHNGIRSGEKFLPDYLRKLEKYMYHQTFIYTPRLFEMEFVRKKGLAGGRGREFTFNRNI